MQFYIDEPDAGSKDFRPLRGPTKDTEFFTDRIQAELEAERITKESGIFLMVFPTSEYDPPSVNGSESVKWYLTHQDGKAIVWNWIGAAWRKHSEEPCVYSGPPQIKTRAGGNSP